MQDQRIPKKQLKMGKRKLGRQKLHYQDAVMISPCNPNVFTRSHKKSINRRIGRKKAMLAGTDKEQQPRIDQSKEKSTARKAATTLPTAATANWQRDECDRICKSRIRLFGHQRTQKENIEKAGILYILYIYENKIDSWAIPSCEARGFEYLNVCTYADTLGQLNTIDPLPFFPGLITSGVHRTWGIGLEPWSALCKPATGFFHAGVLWLKP